MAPHACRRLSICSETKQNDERLILTLSIPARADRNRNRPVDSRTYRARIISPTDVDSAEDPLDDGPKLSHKETQ
jgi:hypothetical protein